MKSLIFGLLLTAGGVLLLFGVAFPQSPPQFKPPVNLGPKINSSFYESDPFWDGPRKRLYFVSARDGTEDIWYSDWTDTGWADVQKLGPQVNSLERELAPSVSPDGQKFYYVTFSRPGAMNVWDIWVSTFDSNTNDWDTPEELPCPVNTPGTEFASKIAPDGKSLYFFSTLGNCVFPQQSGLLFSVFDSLTGWSVPQSLGSNVNTGNGSQYPSVTANGQWLYFDQFVSDGKSIFVSPWAGSMWGPATDLRPQIGGRASSPSVVPTGDSLFFGSADLNSSGNGDIFIMELQPTGIDEQKETRIPRDFELYQNYPNPFNSQTQISLFVSQLVREPVELVIYNILGQPIKTLLQSEKFIGRKEVIWDGLDNSGKELSSGIYLYELRVGNERMVKKAVLIR